MIHLTLMHCLKSWYKPFCSSSWWKLLLRLLARFRFILSPFFSSFHCCDANRDLRYGNEDENHLEGSVAAASTTVFLPFFCGRFLGSRLRGTMSCRMQGIFCLSVRLYVHLYVCLYVRASEPGSPVQGSGPGPPGSRPDPGALAWGSWPGCPGMGALA